MGTEKSMDITSASHLPHRALELGYKASTLQHKGIPTELK